ncbi:MAG: hypothetical protein ACE5L7_10635 [Candidatus Aminicenantales bacterium]
MKRPLKIQPSQDALQENPTEPGGEDCLSEASSAAAEKGVEGMA